MLYIFSLIISFLPIFLLSIYQYLKIKNKNPFFLILKFNIIFYFEKLFFLIYISLMFFIELFFLINFIFSNTQIFHTYIIIIDIKDIIKISQSINDIFQNIFEDISNILKNIFFKNTSDVPKQIEFELKSYKFMGFYFTIHPINFFLILALLLIILFNLIIPSLDFFFLLSLFLIILFYIK